MLHSNFEQMLFNRAHKIHNSQKSTKNKTKKEIKKKRKRETHSYHYYLLAYAKHLPCSLSRITVNNVLYFILFLIFELWILNASSFYILGWLRIQLSSNYQLLFSPNLVFDQSMRCKTHKCIIFELNSSLHWFLVHFGAAARQVLLTYGSVVVLTYLIVGRANRNYFQILSV